MPSCCDELRLSNLPATITRPVPWWYTIDRTWLSAVGFQGSTPPLVASAAARRVRATTPVAVPLLPAVVKFPPK